MAAVPCRLLRVWAVLALSAACASTPTPGAQERGEYALTEDVSLRRVAPGVWVHTTMGSGPYANIPANGLLVEDGDGSILVDTGWDARQAESLLTWAQDVLHRPVKAAVVTHSHEDRTGGISALLARGLPVYGQEETARIAAASKEPVPSLTFAETQALGPLELFFPGHGHAPDNIVVWHPGGAVLFGGCFVKGGESKDLGNVGDADTAAWPASVDRTRERFPQARIVVPGHGAPGGPELLTHTQALLRASPTAR
ncbi:subclass B1 metallo-beta-lactamase [Hyalangium gracile]|uniref:subclass B1 metallo-beta-lactamase n=1 Tax=Hyalangium gracile TaxID=394092 RepID=UPI001CCE3F1C|nr:subclass B1 metallo-beta-lactamase [Hyalangium gracile]